MHLTKRQEALFRGNNAGVNKIAQAIATINALSPAAWYHMRGSGVPTASGGFASMWPDMADTDNGLVCPGVALNSASIPDANYLDLTGDVVIVARCAATDWTSGSPNIAGKLSAVGKAGYRLFMDSVGRLLFMYGNGAALVSKAATASVGFADGEYGWVKVVFDADNGSAQNETKFYTAPDSDSVPTSWTQLGTTITTAGAATIATHNGTFEVGRDGSLGGGQVFTGVIKRCLLYGDLAEATALVDIDFSAQAKGTTSFTESSSNAATVTINQSGALPAHIGNKKDLLQGTGTNQPAYSAGVITFDGVDNYLKTNAFTLNQPVTYYLVEKQTSWTINDTLFDGNTEASIMLDQNTVSSPNVRLYAGNNVVNTTATVGDFQILACVVNGASSSVKINDLAEATGDASTQNAGGLTLAARGSGGSGWFEGAYKEVVVFAAAHDDATQDAVIAALNTLNTVF